ncbi:MAG: branched-chain amino acid ABC transporter permease [Candidatus Dormibacteraeota bacterium]|nr:branched-chain amino acid ABC transporter permease [Candidatus Dormibacteraeota bacterium]
MNWVNAITQGILLGGLYALFACGLSLLFGVVRVVNLAHGDFAVLAAYLALVVITTTHVPALLTFIIVAPLFALFGYGVQRLIIQRSLEVSPLTTLLVTFGLSVVIQNVLLVMASADSHSFDLGSLISASLRVSPELSIGYVPLLIFVTAIVVLVGLQLFLSRTAMGRAIRASADDQEASTIAGVNTRHVFGIAAAIAFATVALAGLALGSSSSFDPSAGPARLIFAFEAVIIGGVGSLWGTLVGGIILGVAQAVGAQIDPSGGVLAGHLVFLVVLALRPQGLIRARLAV